MKPPPDLADEAAMLKRGRMSALRAARKDAIVILRDAYTAMQSDGEWGAMATNARIARDAADRLITLSAMWDELAGCQAGRDCSHTGVGGPTVGF